MTCVCDVCTSVHRYIVFELGEHGSLESHLARLGSSQSIVCASEVRAVAFQMLFSLHVVYREYGIIHCDVKPANFVLKARPPGQVDEFMLGETVWRLAGAGAQADAGSAVQAPPALKRGQRTRARPVCLADCVVSLIDFGLACGDGIPQHMGCTIGYAAPELLLLGKDQRDVASDVWPVAITIADMVATSVDGCAFHAADFHLMDLLGQYEKTDPLFPVTQAVYRAATRLRNRYPIADMQDASVVLAVCLFQHALGNGLLPDVKSWPALAESAVLQAVQAHAACLLGFASDAAVNPYLAVASALRSRLGESGLAFVRACCAWVPAQRPTFDSLLCSDFFAELRCSSPTSPGRQAPSSVVRWGYAPVDRKKLRTTERRRFSQEVSRCMGFTPKPRRTAMAGSPLAHGMSPSGHAGTNKAGSSGSVSAANKPSPSTRARILRTRKRNRAEQDADDQEPERLGSKRCVRPKHRAEQAPSDGKENSTRAAASTPSPVRATRSSAVVRAIR